MVARSRYARDVAVEYKPPAGVPEGGRCVFLAGSIEMGTAEDWQSRLVQEFSAEPSLALLNPRRDAWDPSWRQSADNPEFAEQVCWELDGLDRADVIALYLVPGSRSPISLLEFGLHARSGKLVVLCPDGFWRKGNVEVVCARYGVELHVEWDAWVAALRSRLAG